MHKCWISKNDFYCDAFKNTWLRLQGPEEREVEELNTGT